MERRDGQFPQTRLREQVGKTMGNDLGGNELQEERRKRWKSWKRGKDKKYFEDEKNR